MVVRHQRVKVHFTALFPSAPVYPTIFSSKTPAVLFFPIHSTWRLSTSIYDPLRQTRVTGFVMKWRMKSFGSQKHLIWFRHFDVYVSLVYSGKTSCLCPHPPPSFVSDLPYLLFPPLFFPISLLFTFVRLSICCNLCVILRIYSESFVATKWCGCCFSSWLSCL